MFQIEVLPFADGDGGNVDAGNVADGDDYVDIGSTGIAEGSYGYEDFKDVWRFDQTDTGRYVATLTHQTGGAKYRLTVYDEASGKRLGRGNNGPAEFDATGPVRIEIENRTPKTRPELATYTITVTHE